MILTLIAIRHGAWIERRRDEVRKVRIEYLDVLIATMSEWTK